MGVGEVDHWIPIFVVFVVVRNLSLVKDIVLNQKLNCSSLFFLCALIKIKRPLFSAQVVFIDLKSYTLLQIS